MTIPKNLNLVLSGIIVIIAGFVYGGHPTVIMPELLGFEVVDLELKNMLRAGATMCNVLFMGGISFGRTVSTVVDGISPLFTPALILELLFFGWGLYNLKKYKEVI